MRITTVYLMYSLIKLISGEYYIKHGAVPSYLYGMFDYNERDVFPHDIQINFSLSRVAGTLLYSIDRHMNQLIMTLHDSITPTLGIEFNKRQHYTSLTTLCGCKICKYEVLNLRIQIDGEIRLRCNGGNNTTWSINVIKEINKDYPIPKIDENSGISHMWLVNTPQYDDIYPNSDQLVGCIFNVSHNGKPISFRNVTANIGRRCTKTCVGNICNGGKCHETYNDHPLCDCTRTFLNGLYCNSSISPRNIRSVSQYFILEVLKISWRSTVHEILKLANAKAHVRIFGNNDGLFLEYAYKKNITITGSLATEYTPNTESICIIQFQENSLDIWTFTSMSWNHALMPINRDLRKEIFSSLTLRSGEGIIDVMFKNSPSKLIWSKINIMQSESIENENQKAVTNAPRVNIIQVVSNDPANNSTDGNFSNLEANDNREQRRVPLRLFKSDNEYESQMTIGIISLIVQVLNWICVVVIMIILRNIPISKWRSSRYTSAKTSSEDVKL